MPARQIVERSTPQSTMYVLEISEGLKPYQKEAQRITGGPRRNVFRNFRDFVETNQTFLVSFSVALSSLLLLFQVIQALGFIPNKSNSEGSKSQISHSSEWTGTAD